MQNKYSKKQLEELYCCHIFKSTGFEDSGSTFWIAEGLPIEKNNDNQLFSSASGFTLEELHEEIRQRIKAHCIKF